MVTLWCDRDTSASPVELHAPCQPGCHSDIAPCLLIACYNKPEGKFVLGIVDVNGVWAQVDTAPQRFILALWKLQVGELIVMAASLLVPRCTRPLCVWPLQQRQPQLQHHKAHCSGKICGCV